MNKLEMAKLVTTITNMLKDTSDTLRRTIETLEDVAQTFYDEAAIEKE